MEEANAQLARAAFAALGAFDAAAVIELTDPAVEWHSFFALGEETGVYRGHDGTRQFVADLSDAFEVIEAEIEGALEIGELALLVGHICYRGRTSGAESRSAAGWVFKFRAGRVVYFRAFNDPEPTIAALGLPRSPPA